MAMPAAPAPTVTTLTMCDKQGALYVGCPGMNWAQAEMAKVTNPEQTPGTLAEKLVGAGFVTIDGLKAADPEAFNNIDGLDPEEVKAAVARLND